jgi:hypothetical protein
MYKMDSRNFKTCYIKNIGRQETNKGTQRGLQQTLKWNKGHYKNGAILIKVDTQI